MARFGETIDMAGQTSGMEARLQGAHLVTEESVLSVPKPLIKDPPSAVLSLFTGPATTIDVNWSAAGERNLLTEFSGVSVGTQMLQVGLNQAEMKFQALQVQTPDWAFAI
jgi:hypothetical protein